MTASHQTSPAASPAVSRGRRRSLVFFGFALIALALVVIASPFSARALQSAGAGKDARQAIPPAPTGRTDVALPYEAGPAQQMQQPDQHGGPDSYGYVYDDNNEPGGPTFSWLQATNRVPDTSWTAVRSVLTTTARDDGVVTATLPFNFNYYGTQSRTLRISTNGNAHFGAPNDWFPAQASQCLPYNSAEGYVPLGMMAPLWYDFVVPDNASGGGVYTDVVGTSPNQIFIVEWRRVTSYNSTSSYATFELLLYENGEMRFQYNEIQGNRIGGAEAVIGIQNLSGNVGLPYSCYVESVIPGRAIRYRLRQSAVFLPNINQRGASPGSTVIYTQTLANQTGIANSFGITLTAGGNWPTAITPTHTSLLNNGASTQVLVSVQVPQTATLGSRDVSTVLVSSDLPSPGYYTATGVFTTSVSSYGADFIPPSQTRSGSYGTTVTYSALLTNTSPLVNSFAISLSDNLWPTTLSTYTVTNLAPNTSAPITVSVSVPADSSLGDSDSVEIMARGQEPTPGQYFGFTVITTTAGVWRTRSSMPIARSRGAGVMYHVNDHVYAIGGESSGGNNNLPIEEYDPIADAWTMRANLQVGVSNIGAGVISDTIYIPGGYNPAAGGALATMQVFYPLENRTAILASDELPLRRMGAGVAVANNKLYLIGGSDSSLVGTNTLFEYDPARPAGSRWQQKASMRYPRIYLGAASVDGLIYAVGGMPGGPNDLNVMEIYNPATNTWTTGAPMNRGRSGLALVGVDSGEPGCGGHLYAIGGGWQSFTNTAERYNPATGEWTTLSSVTSARRSLAAVYSPGTYSLVAFGGWDGGYEIINEEARCSGSFSPPTVTPGPTVCPIPFSDVQVSDYFYQPVAYLYCHGVISGYADNTFRPYNNTTRAQLAKIVVLAEGWAIDTGGGPHFSDVPTSNPFYSFVETAYNHGVISGYSDGTFRPGADVTRGQLSKIVVVAEGWVINTTGGPHFSDVPTTDPFYSFVETAYNRGIISGYSDGTFRPGSSATRGQISKIVYNAIQQPLGSPQQPRK